jgi:hypothetical protein
MQAAAEEQLAQSMATPLQVLTGIVARPAQVANGFLRGGRRADRRQQTRPSQFDELARIAAIGLDPLARLSGNQRRRHDVAAHPRRCHLPLQCVAARTGFIEDAHQSRGLALELPHQATHGIRRVGQLPRGRRRLGSHQHRDEEVLLVRINPDVRSNLFHDRLLSMRLWRREALTRDLGGTDHLVECNSTTTLR